VLLTVSFTDPREGPRTALLRAADPSDEKAIFERALVAFARKPDAPVYHHGPSVPSQLARMEARHGTGDRGLAVLDRLIDVAAWVRRAAALPVSAYTLEATARATGYEGPQPDGDVLPDVLRLAEGDAGAGERLLAAADAEREAIRHLLRWLRRSA
jgi:predicted RecB family nuclease